MDHRICAITGGAGALGGALASRLAGAGYRVALYDVAASRARLDAIAATLGAQAYVHAGDFARAETWDAALEGTRRALGGSPSHAALVAGGFAGGAPLHAADDDAAYDAMMRSNVDTTYRALRALLPAMVAAKKGSLVAVGSRAVERPWTSAGSAAYAASKAAVVTMAQVAAREVLDHGVRINAVLPSTMDTPANRAAMPSADPTTWVSLASAAGVIAFLLSDDAADVTGAALPVYGRV